MLRSTSSVKHSALNSFFLILSNLDKWPQEFGSLTYNNLYLPSFLKDFVANEVNLYKHFLFTEAIKLLDKQNQKKYVDLLQRMTYH